jgi:uncharacterized membrane protein YagU involved in acid resistance
MIFETFWLADTIFVGVGATAMLDTWSLFLKLAFKVASPNICMVGRWLLYMPQGRFTHASIAAAEPKQAECAAGWILHYLVGVVFAFVFIVLVTGAWLERPTLLPALLFGIATVLFPLFLLQPSLGHGIAASKTPNPTQARLKSLMTHAVFGLGLYGAAVCLNCLR